MKYAFTYLGIDLYFSDHDWSKTSILFENEFWKEVPEYNGYYFISSLGRLKSIDRKVRGKDGRVFTKSGSFISQHDRSGYKHSELNLYSSGKKWYIHRLVAIAFIPNPENKPQVNHKNCIRHHNWLSNLEWMTHSENCKHVFRVGKHSSGVIDDSCLEELKYMVESGMPYGEIREYFGIKDKSNSTIYKYIREQGWYRPFGWRSVSDEVAEEIRRIHKNKRYGYKETAKKFGISNHEIVGRIVRREGYKTTKNERK